MTILFFQLIVSGQVGPPVDHALKAVIVDNNNIQDTKQEVKVMVDIVQGVHLKMNCAILKVVLQVSFPFTLFDIYVHF